jgi:hypothetical protein
MHPGMKSIVISSSQHTDLLAPFLKSFEVRVDHDLRSNAAWTNARTVLSRK